MWYVRAVSGRGSGDWVAVAYRSVSHLSESSDHSRSAEGFNSAKEAREVVLAAAAPFLDQ